MPILQLFLFRLTFDIYPYQFGSCFIRLYLSCFFVYSDFEICFDDNCSTFYALAIKKSLTLYSAAFSPWAHKIYYGLSNVNMQQTGWLSCSKPSFFLVSCIMHLLEPKLCCSFFYIIVFLFIMFPKNGF